MLYIPQQRSQILSAKYSFTPIIQSSSWKEDLWWQRAWILNTRFLSVQPWKKLPSDTIPHSADTGQAYRYMAVLNTSLICAQNLP